MKEYTKDDFVFFWGGEFSQWYKSYFVINSVQYNCAEQWMMAEKARLFQDWDTCEQIMKSKSPSKQKALGRTVKGFDISTWFEHCQLIVYRGNLAKFTQNKDLYKYIISTGSKWIVEASPEDSIWGIGMAENHPNILYPHMWNGTNLLGQVLMMVREDIKGLYGKERE